MGGWGWGYLHVNLLYWYKGQVKPGMRRKGTVTKGMSKRNVAYASLAYAIILIRFYVLKIVRMAYTRVTKCDFFKAESK